jgi:hypothetical protein
MQLREQDERNLFLEAGAKSRTQAAVMIAPEINLSLLLISGFGFRHRTANPHNKTPVH